jgi:hypothetical protein
MKRTAMSRRRKECRREATPYHSPRRHLCRIRRKQHAELATVLSHLSDVSNPCRFDPLTRRHRCCLCGRIDVGPATSESRVREPRLPEKACHRAQRAGSAATHLYAWKGVYVYLLSTSSFLESSPLTLAHFDKLLPDFDWLRRLEPRHQGPPRHCPAAESSFIVQHRDHKLTVEPRLMAAGGRLRLVRKSVERHRFTVSA